MRSPEREQPTPSSARRHRVVVNPRRKAATGLSLGAQFARVWRGRHLVAAIVVVSALAAWASVRESTTTYTATAALMTVSANRAPEQDGILARGYVDLFVEPSFQQSLRQQAQVPTEVQLEARTAAASPIIYVSATSADAASAKAAAARVAEEFRAEVNASLRTGRDRTIARMRKPIDDQRKSSSVPEVALIQLQDRINAMNADPTNELEVLQYRGGVVASVPPMIRVVGVGVLGGLLLGCLLAWSIAYFSRRLVSPYDLQEKVGVEPLVVIPPADVAEPGGGREKYLRQLTMTVALADLNRPAVFAVAPVHKGLVSMHAAEEISMAIAAFRAEQGVRTVLVTPSRGRVTLPEEDADTLLDGRFMLTESVDEMLSHVFPVGDLDDVFMRLGPERMTSLIDVLRHRADLVVICSPPVGGSAEADVFCASADRTLVLVAAGDSAADVTAACDSLDRMGAECLGVAFLRWQRRQVLSLRRRPRSVPTVVGKGTTVVTGPVEETGSGPDTVSQLPAGEG